MDSQRGKLVALLAAFILSGVLAAKAQDLPAWGDDSGISIGVSPSRFMPLQESVNLEGRVFHPTGVRTQVRWIFSIQDGEGREVRRWTGEQTYQPGEAMQFGTAWDGRDSDGAIVQDGLYSVVLEVKLAAKGEATAAMRRRQGEQLQPEAGGRAEAIQQRFRAFVTAGPSPSGGRESDGHFRMLAAPNEPGFPFNFYFGTLHTQTSYSDGGHPNDLNCASSTIHGPTDLDPAGAYSYARNTAKLDFLGISDHNHFFADACSGCTAAQVVQRYHNGLSAAATANVDGSFVAIYGMEWGYISSPDFPNEGHVNLYETPKLFGWDPSGCTIGSTCYYEVFTDPAGVNYPTMYTQGLANPSTWGAFGQFNHPSDGTKSAAGQGVDFNQFQYTTDGDDLIHGIAVISGPATDFSTTGTDTGYRYAGEPVNGPQYSAYNSSDMYNLALGAGFHVAPTADSDVHCANYGTSTRDRTVILATALTKAALFDAIHHRRVYATSRRNAQLVFTMKAGSTTYYMGDGGIRTSGPIATTGSITLHTSVWDPAGAVATSIKVKEPAPNNTDGSATLIASSTASPFDYTFTPPAGKHTYYVYVTLNTGDELWSAPIWINQGGAASPDFTISATPSSQTVTAGTGTSYTATVTAVNGFTGTVSFSVSGLPAGATGSFNPTSVAGSGNSTLSVSTGSTALAGTYALTITGTSGALVHSTTVTLVVNAPPAGDFSISATPGSQTVTRGLGTSYTVTVTASGGFAGTVSLSVSGLPNQTTASFNPSSITGSGSSTLTVKTGTKTRPGTSTLTITGTSGSLTHSTNVTLVVQ